MNSSSLQMLAGFAPELSLSTFRMKNILTELSGRKSVKSAIKANWEAYHYCLAQSPSVELSIGRYLTWLIKRADGNISKAARDADMDRKYLHKLLRKYGITGGGDDEEN